MDYFSTEMRDGILIATYTAPPMNYFTAAGAGELGELIAGWADPAVRAVVLTGGVPGKFITHYSVEELESYAADRAQMTAIGTSLNDGYHALLDGLRALAKPVITAINGDCMGGGFELALSTDIRVMAAGDHRIGLPEVALGIMPGGCGTQALSRLLGPHRAIEFILRSRILAPEAALAAGIVHEVAKDAKARALEIAAELVRQPATSLASVKRAVYGGYDLPYAEGLKLEAEAFLATMLDADGLARMRHYTALPLAERRAWLERGGR